MKRLSILWPFLALLSAAVFAQNVEGDAAAIRSIIEELEKAWTAGDAEAWSKHVADDVDFTVWNGRYIKGREGVTAGHRQIFSTIYKDTKQKLDVRSIRFLRDDVAVVHLKGSVVKKTAEFPEAPQVAPVMIMTKQNGRWLIAVFHNTDVQKRPRAEATD